MRNLITMVTPVDFHVEGQLNAWVGAGSESALDVDLLVKTLGNVPGNFLNAIFLMLKPFQLGVQKYIDLLESCDRPERLLMFLHMEKWIFDSPDQAGEAFRQFIKDFYQGNKLIQGTVAIDNRRIDLSKIHMPVLNIYAEQDHLVPAASSTALKHYVGSEDYSECSFPVGHIGMYVSSKVQNNLPPTIADWLRERV